MIVAKFGGTCITAQNLKRLKTIVKQNYKAVVVSAIGKNFDGDTKVTDLLYKLHNSLPDTSCFVRVAQKYRHLVKSNAIDIDIEKLLSQTLADIRQKNSLDNTVSKGEELSAKIVARFLDLQYVEVEPLIVFQKGKLNLNKSVKNLSNAFKGVKQCVLGGFYGSENGQRAIFSRGGSDITGAIVANAVGACMYENWTDVDGFFVSNPRLVFQTKLINCLSYDEMKLLSDCGATVLHPDSVYPTQIKGIPIHIRNIYNTSSAGTIVNSQHGKGQVLGVFEKLLSAHQYQTHIVFSCEILDVLKWVSSVCPNGLISIKSQKNIVTLESWQSLLNILTKTLPDNL